MAGFSLQESFWREFLHTYWEKKPTSLNRLFASPILSPEALFDAVVGMPSTKTAGDRFWVSTRTQPVNRDDFRFVPLDKYGPRREDGGFGSFFDRVKRDLGNWPIGINIHHLERSCPRLWFDFREFVSGINRVTGTLPSGRWDIDMFLGTYEATPLGIHRDNASVFTMGVLGRRTYYTWPADYFKPGDPALATLDMASIKPHFEHAVRMDLGPGEVVYWPSSNWHLVVSDGSPSAVVSISAYFGDKLSTVVTSQVRQLLAAHFSENDFQTVYDMSELPAQPPRSLVAAHQVLAHAVRDGRLSDAMQQYWLMFRTAEGMHSVPSVPDARLEADDRVAVDNRFPIVWARLSTGDYIVAVNGLAFSISNPGDGDILDLLQQLNSGRSFRVSELLETHQARNIGASYIMEVLNLLHRCRAFRAGNC